ncbi:bifunctional ADP-dependent NAD(P)H-hydrate dehydratase/NAD(P)H-hydrate epimerase [Algoriphagus vanfongensis]|uniref:bifunctional ADP-dependent NAD(P)H-hydrate dehydratase/NAD(P)H-hydrate epimerase n=1 Tax=Algoriphagus vanfongensis TaxID=426371 RepID=UPI000478B897|nr:bifunctional ADP-dependent NAD(P)H-hydrate dehydratase/NAD(P)H-hydrate epimerase [Algoriphagus vanfongensis]
MIKILKGENVKELDSRFCKITKTPSLELMENAARFVEEWFYQQHFSKDRQVLIFVGAGNNGGDGLAIARLISQKNYPVQVVKCFAESAKLSPDAAHNLEYLPTQVKEVFLKDFESSDQNVVVIDAFLGVGLQGDLRKDALEAINQMNELSGIKIALDIPSGMYSEGVVEDTCFMADVTISFAFPKLALLLPENAAFTGNLIVADIGIGDQFYGEFEEDLFFLQKHDLAKLHRMFHRFSHKGDFGKILLVGGSLGKMGAMVLASKAALRTGAGLVTCHVEESEHQILQVAVPEAMCNWGLIPNADYYDAVGIGPGWGVDHRKSLLERLLKDNSKPMVIDADGINILAKHPELLGQLPKNSILTPHVGEFHRLVGNAETHLIRMEKAKSFSIEHGLILILKGANTVISFPDGKQVINSSGSQFMATGGSGDVLTGMITAFLGMGYAPENAALCAAYHHGLAGELAGEKKRRGTIASDIIQEIPETYLKLGVDSSI